MVKNDSIICGSNPAFTANPINPIADCKAHGLPTTPQGLRSCDDPVLLQKRFFGSISLSQEYYRFVVMLKK